MELRREHTENGRQLCPTRQLVTDLPSLKSDDHPLSILVEQLENLAPAKAVTPVSESYSQLPDPAMERFFDNRQCSIEASLSERRYFEQWLVARLVEPSR